MKRGESPLSEIVYEFEDILEQIQHTLATEDKQQFREIFFENHTYDQAQIYLSLTLEERKLAYQFLTPEEMAMVFELLEEDVEDVEKYLSEMDEAYVSRMIAEMYSDNAVDVLKQVGEDTCLLNNRFIMSKEDCCYSTHDKKRHNPR